jgi:hypothetical protein
MNDNKNKQILPGGRVFSTDLGPVVEYLLSTGFFDTILPATPAWKITGGNFFTTSTPYRIHADTGRDQSDLPYRILVIPLEIIGDGRSTLHVLSQRWYGPAAFFLHGGDKQGYNRSEWNACVFDYKDVIDRSGSRLDSNFLKEEFPHINLRNFDDLSIMASMDWQIGDVMIFDRSHLHVTNDFRKTGIVSKSGLSLFLSINN